jgi:glycosyltransferase involved in cell wall biosynthesis
MIRVSTVIPTFNRREYIRRAIDSVLAQTVPVDEIIIVDDEKSTDNIAEAVDQWYGPSIRVVKQGGGLSGARRRGVQEARGEWIAFLDSDDDWAVDRNRQFLEAASKVPPDVAWIFGDLRVVTDAGDGMTLFEEFGLSVEESPHVFADSLTVQFPFQFGLLQGSFIRRSVLLELDCFNEGLNHSEDLFAGFQVACRYRFAAIPSVVGRYYRTSDLAANSALLKGNSGADYFRSRMLCFELVVKSGRKRPWNLLYASAVFGLCKVLAEQGRLPRGLARQQFRYGGISAKGLAFYGAALFGQGGVETWTKVAKLRRKLFPEKVSVAKNGLQASMASPVSETSK